VVNFTGENVMSQKDTKRAPEAPRTAESALGELLTHIKDLVESRLLDSRCAAKLVRRINKEFVLVSKSGKLTKSGDRSLQDAFEAVDAALHAEDARLLVEANAVLRAADSAAGADSERRGVEVFGTGTD
jgi:hypothetical protein